ncbi:MAG: acyltransferase [Cytophagaceae bacterium]|nr:MAG: acyltransferase [Cytophagaceae bacterium]
METSIASPQAVTPEQLKLSRTFDFNLEALRGFAAILVVWHHVLEHQHWLDPHYIPTGILSFNPPGHLSVVVFFVLSGYVIGRVHPLPLGQADIVPYMKKRLLRIYPIYLVSMALALAVAEETFPPLTILSNLTMTQTQDDLAPVIFHNNPAWSLSFELLFYLLFIPLSFFRLSVPLVALAVALVGIVAGTQEYYHFASAILGFALWLCGVLIARYLQRPAAPSFALMVSMLFLLISLKEFNTLGVLFTKLSVFLAKPYAIEAGAIQIIDLSYLPYCVLFVVLFAGRDFAYRQHFTALLLLLPAVAFYKKLHHPDVFQNRALIIPTCFYISAVLIYFFRKQLEQLSSRLIHRLSSTGAYSYGLYIIHFPIIAIFVRIGWFSGTPFTFFVRFVCYVFLCFSAAYVLEKKFQPWVKQLFLSPKTT